MKWAFEATHCFCLEHAPYDLLGEILTATHDALRQGIITMTDSELVDFNTLCEQAGLTLPILTPATLPTLRRIK